MKDAISWIERPASRSRTDATDRSMRSSDYLGLMTHQMIDSHRTLNSKSQNYTVSHRFDNTRNINNLVVVVAVNQNG